MLIRKKVLVFVIIFLVPNLIFGEPVIYKFNLGQKKQKKIWAMSDKGFNDIRYDSDGDGKIDIWQVRSGKMSFKAFFRKNQIVYLIYEMSQNQFFIKANYKLQKNKFVLVGATALAKKTDFLGPSLSRQADSCKSTRLASIFPAEQWEELSGNLLATEVQKKWYGTISRTCEPIMEDVKGAVNRAVYLDPKGEINQNHMLECLASSSSTEYLVPNYVEIAMGPIVDPNVEIVCQQDEGPGCGGASYTHDKKRYLIKYKVPKCSSNMTDVYTGFLEHENLHAICARMPEKTIENILNSCRISSNTLEIPTETLASKESDRGVIMGQAETEQIMVSTAQDISTYIPAEFAETQLATTINGIPGTQFLNESLSQNIYPAAIPNHNQIENSLAVSAPIFATSNSVMRAAAAHFSVPAVAATFESAPVIAQPKGDVDTALHSVADGEAKSSIRTNSVTRPKKSSTNSRKIASAGSAIDFQQSNEDKQNGSNERISDFVDAEQLASKISSMTSEKALEFAILNEPQLRNLKVILLRPNEAPLGYQNPKDATKKLVIRANRVEVVKQ